MGQGDRRANRGGVRDHVERLLCCGAGTKPYTLHPAPCTLHPEPYTLHPTPFILHPTPYTLHPEPYTLHSTPDTLHVERLQCCGAGTAMPYMYALYVCLICMPYMYAVAQVLLCLMCMPYMYAVAQVLLGFVLRGVCKCMPYMYALYVCYSALFCAVCINVCLICMPYMYALYVCYSALFCAALIYTRVHTCRVCSYAISNSHNRGCRMNTRPPYTHELPVELGGRWTCGAARMSWL